ncbi:MAG: Fic family protein [Thiomargarita sp.]|nr:Fic family protein [Thiomargarita sp.]
MINIMQKSKNWIWQEPKWPDFHYDVKQVLSDLNTLLPLIGAFEMSCKILATDVLLDAQVQVLAEDAIETSAIEGEMLRHSSVRASIQKKLGLPLKHDDSNLYTDSIVDMLLDVRQNAVHPLTEQMIFAWHAALFPTGYSGLHKIHVGRYRGTEDMHIVSGAIGKEKIHYIAPPQSHLQEDMSQCLFWINQDKDIHPILKAGIAHLWLIMIHPFDDGNGRISRAVTDYVLTKHFPLLMHYISLSKQVSLDRKGYYLVLEASGKQGLDITPWLVWFLQTLTAAINTSHWCIDQVLYKTQFWHQHRHTPINMRQQKVMNCLLEYGNKFEGGMTTRKYAHLNKCSKVTASRDLSDLEHKNMLQKQLGGGRSTRYEIKDLFTDVLPLNS